MLQKAKDYAFLLLKFRLRSEHELRQRLAKKKFDPRIVEEAISFLKDKGFIDDSYFAKAWIESRIKRPLGIRRLRHELIVKGIDRAVIESRISEIKESYCEEETVLNIAKERLGKLRGYDPQKARRRVYAYLMCRGFSPEAVIKAINQFKGSAR